MMTAAARERRRVCGGGYRGTIGAREERKVREKIQRGKRVCAISGKEALKVSDGMGEEEERERGGGRGVSAASLRDGTVVEVSTVGMDMENEMWKGRDAFAELVKMTGKAQVAERERNGATRKPRWLVQRAPQGEKYESLHSQLRGLNLNTVCEEAQV